MGRPSLPEPRGVKPDAADEAADEACDDDEAADGTLLTCRRVRSEADTARLTRRGGAGGAEEAARARKESQARGATRREEVARRREEGRMAA